MDRIYTELLQKDSLMAQAKISRSKAFKYTQIIDSTKKDINSLKTHINGIEDDYYKLLQDNQKKQNKIILNRRIAIIGILVGLIGLAL